MSEIIPLLGDFTEQELNTWLSALSNVMPSETFLPFSELSESQRLIAKLAIVANPNPDDLKELPNLIWVQSLWAGVESMVATFRESPLKLVRLKDPALADSMAEAALTWSLFLHRNMHRYQASQQEHQWAPIAYKAAQERSVGILGMGALGQSVAKTLLNNGFDVMGWSRSPKQFNDIKSYSGLEELGSMLSRSDIVICLLPLTDATLHLLNAERFAQCKPQAKLLNFGRGAVIDDNALLASLNANHLDHAVLDVFSVEPLPEEHPYWSHPNVTVLPHISAQTRPDTASMVVKYNIEQFRLTGKVPEFVDFKQGY